MAITGGCLCGAVRFEIEAEAPLSGSTMHRRFCSQCGTPIFSEAEQRPHQIVVRVGTLDDPNLAKPAGIIWTKSAPVWACFDPHLPQAEGQAPPPRA